MGYIFPVRDAATKITIFFRGEHGGFLFECEQSIVWMVKNSITRLHSLQSTSKRQHCKRSLSGSMPHREHYYLLCITHEVSWKDGPHRVLRKAVTAVGFCPTPLCRTAFYTVHGCIGKSDAFIISLVPMVTKMDVLMFVWFRAQWSRLCPRDRLFNTQRKEEEAYANITCDLFVDTWRISLTSYAHHNSIEWRHSDPFIQLLSCGTVCLWPSGEVGRHPSTGGVWQQCCS